MRLLACCLLMAAAASAQDRSPVDWRKLEPEILANFTALLKIDTSNPPGNETAAANAIKAILEREGIACQLFALDPARANLVARIKGTGTKKPLLIMGHTDVVGVQREKWSVDPFGAINKNGVIYARGARDDKPHVVAGDDDPAAAEAHEHPAGSRRDLPRRGGRRGHQHLRHRLHGEGALAGDRGRVRHRRGRLDRRREGQAAPRADQQHREIAAAHAPGGARTGRARLAARDGERRGAPRRGGGARRQLADPDAARTRPRASTSSAWRRFRRPNWRRAIATF